MDDLTTKIRQILDTPDGEVDLDGAALILLRINRNRILYQNIIRGRRVEKLKYELGKIYSFRIREDAVRETARLEKEAVRIVRETFPKEEEREKEETKGKRRDHELLPDELKAKFFENRNIYLRMRKLHEQLKLLVNARACDRYEYLRELVALDKKTRENWDAYDGYSAASVPPPDPIAPREATGAKEGEGESVPAGKNADFNEISAARKYLSNNKAKLAELKGLPQEREKYEALLGKVQARLDLLLALGPVSPGNSSTNFSPSAAVPKEVPPQVCPVAGHPLQAFYTDRLQLFDLIEALLHQLGGACNRLFLTSFSVSEEFIRRIYRFRREMPITQAVLLLDAKAAAKVSKLLPFARSVFDEIYLATTTAR